jgi:hypothetical protein
MYWLVFVVAGLLCCILLKYVWLSGLFHNIRVVVGDPPFGDMHIGMK